MKHVIIADPYPIFIKGITTLLEKDKEAYKVVEKANTFSMLSNVLNTAYPDIIILDLDLPGIEGISAITVLKNQNPNSRILISSAQPENLYAPSALEAGASGYISKYVSLKIFKKAVDQISRGGIYLSDTMNKKISSKSNHKTNSQYKKLSTRETEVLNLISKGKRNKDIADILDINEKTVSTYKSRLFKKLQVDSIAELINQSKMLKLAI